jgi:hypothetical protein
VFLLKETVVYDVHKVENVFLAWKNCKLSFLKVPSPPGMGNLLNEAVSEWEAARCKGTSLRITRTHTRRPPVISQHQVG